MAYTQVLGTCAVRRGGSSPLPGTEKINHFSGINTLLVFFLNVV